MDSQLFAPFMPFNVDITAASKGFGIQGLSVMRLIQSSESFNCANSMLSFSSTNSMRNSSSFLYAHRLTKGRLIVSKPLVSAKLIPEIRQASSREVSRARPCASLDLGCRERARTASMGGRDGNHRGEAGIVRTAAQHLPTPSHDRSWLAIRYISRPRLLLPISPLHRTNRRNVGFPHR